MKDGLGSVEDVAVAKGLVRDTGGGAASEEDFTLLSFLVSSSDSGDQLNRKNFGSKNPLEFRLEMPYTKKMFKNG